MYNYHTAVAKQNELLAIDRKFNAYYHTTIYIWRQHRWSYDCLLILFNGISEGNGRVT